MKKIALHLKNETFIFTALIALAILFAMLYAYFISMSVVNTVKREHLAREAAALSSEVGELEFQYISEKNSLTLSYVEDLGFTDASERTSFVSRSSLGLSLYTAD